MIRFRKLFVPCCLLLLGLARPLAAAEALLLPTGYGETLFQTRNVLQFAAEVGVATGGRVRIEVRPGGQHLPLAKIRAAVEAGSVPLGEFILSGEAAVDPVFGLDTLPFVTQSYEDAELLWKISRPPIENALRKRGLVLLYAVPWPPQGIYANRSLEKMKDMAGLRLRTYNATTVELSRLVAAQPVSVPMTELRAALGEGRLDMLLTSATSGVDVRAWEFLKHYYDVRAWFPKNVVVINAQALALLSPDDRKALLMAAKAAETRGWQASRAQDIADQALLKARGMRVEIPSPELAAGLQRVGEKLVREYLRSAGSDALSALLSFNLERGSNR